MSLLISTGMAQAEGLRMRWFKHFTDNHRGRSVQFLMDEMGHAGLSYFIIMELCAEKLDRFPDQELTTSHCEFSFNWRILEFATRLKRAKLNRLLICCAEANLLTVIPDEKQVKISMPILLDLLDYDSKKSRTGRATVAHGSRSEKRREEENRIEKNRIEKNIHTATLPVAHESSDENLHPLIELWNQHCGTLAKVKKSSSLRIKKCKALFKDLSEPEWVEVIKRMAASDFCCGKNNTGWQATFDFFINPKTYLKVLEGTYDNRASTTYGKTEDGRYLTNAVKRSHNNKIMIEKYLKGNGEKDEQITDVGTDSIDCGVPRG